MTPLKIHNGGSHALMEYLTCWKCAIFHAVTPSCLYLDLSSSYPVFGLYALVDLVRSSVYLNHY